MSNFVVVDERADLFGLDGPADFFDLLSSGRNEEDLGDAEADDELLVNRFPLLSSVIRAVFFVLNSSRTHLSKNDFSSLSRFPSLNALVTIFSCASFSAIRPSNKAVASLIIQAQWWCQGELL